MLPADQCFGFVDVAGRQFHNGLVSHPELMVGQCAVQVIYQPQPGLCRLLHAQREITKTVAPLLFGCVHGLVGFFEQIVHVNGIIWIQHNADAERNIAAFII